MTMTRTTYPIKRDAFISGSGRYRWWLSRSWGDLPWCCWIMLNPSAADADQDDPTIRRCMGFSQAWGWGGMAVVNLFALRATNPKDLQSAADPIGVRCNEFIDLWARRAGGPVIAAWGTHGALLHRGRDADGNRLYDSDACVPGDEGDMCWCCKRTRDKEPT